MHSSFKDMSLDQLSSDTMMTIDKVKRSFRLIGGEIMSEAALGREAEEHQKLWQ